MFAAEPPRRAAQRMGQGAGVRLERRAEGAAGAAVAVAAAGRNGAARAARQGELYDDESVLARAESGGAADDDARRLFSWVGATRIER